LGISSLSWQLNLLVTVGYKKGTKLRFCAFFGGRSGRPSQNIAVERPSDVQQWPSGQTQAALLPQGRANSELRNVAPQGEAAAEAQKNSPYS